MNNDMNTLIVDKTINNLIRKEKWSQHLLSDLADKFVIIIFGGAVRDILYNQKQNIRDLDFVLYPKDKKDYQKQAFLLHEIIDKNCPFSYCQNQFHGYKLQGKCNTMDIWLLKDTWAFQQELLAISPQNLLKSVYLNIDAYAWNYNKKKFISQCDKKKTNVIDIVLEQTACEYLNLIRAILFGEKYNMYLSDRIIEKLCEMLQKWTQIEDEVLLIEEHHYGYVKIGKQDIQKTIERQRKNHEKYML